MSRPIRVHRAGSTVHVFNRTLGQLYRLKPTPEMVAGVHRILIKQQRRHRMRIVSYVFLSNHFHLVLRIRCTHQLSAFMRDLQSEIALLSYEIFEGPGQFWERRFRSQELCTPAAIRSTVRYVTSHGAKEGIVASPTAWGGPTCARQMSDPSLAPRTRVVDPKTGIVRVHVLRLSRVPEDEALSYPRWLRQQAALVASIEAEYAMGPFLGMERAMRIPALWGPPQPRRVQRARMVSWKCTDAAGDTDEAALTRAKAHYDTIVKERAGAVDGTVRGGIADIEHPVDCAFSHLIPSDLRRLLVGCANAGRAPVIRTGPGTHPDTPGSPPRPRDRDETGGETPPRPPDEG